MDRAARQLVLRAGAAAMWLLAAATPAFSQAAGTGQEGFSTHTYASLGYVVNAPDQTLGVSAMALGPAFGGWGIYVDGKLTRDSPEGEDNFEPSMTASDVASELPEDLLFREESTWRSLNGAVVRELGPEFALYAGAGVSRETAYDEYQSDERRGTADAYYWVEDEGDSATELNVLGGAVLRASRHLLFHFGAEANPEGFTVGASLGLPLDG